MSTAAHVKVERVCATPTAHRLSCFALRQVSPNEPAAARSNAVTPNATPAGYRPSDLRSAYKLTATGGGTVAIVDAYNDPSAERDLAAYRSQYGLPACTTANGCFKKVSQTGSTTSLPRSNQGWAGEISPDVDMVSAICPGCHILLVEAKTPTTANLGTAVNEAVKLGAKYVSNSYGGPENSSVTSADSYYDNHPGVAITASSGDSDYDGGSFPATSPHVTAAGGTTQALEHVAWLERDGLEHDQLLRGRGLRLLGLLREAGLPERREHRVQQARGSRRLRGRRPGDGCGCLPDLRRQRLGRLRRHLAAAPMIAGVYALAGTPSVSYPNADPYAHKGNLFDVTSGKNGTCGAPLCTAGTGYDGPTGLGTPNGTAAFTG